MQQGMHHDMPQYPPYGGAPGSGAAAGRGAVLAPGARTAGALICAAVLVIEIAWTIRDVNAVGFHETLRLWLGLRIPGEHTGLIATGALDAVLIVVLAGALATARRPGASGAFAAAGALLAGYRLPGVWIFQSPWTEGAPQHGRALATALACTLAGLALLVIALAGLRPAAPAGPDVPPAPPRRGPAVAAGVLLVVLAVETAAWQLFDLHKYSTDHTYPPHLYLHLFTGERTLSALLDAPNAWSAWLTVVLALIAAVAAFAGAPLSRALGLALGFALVVNGAVVLDLWHTEKVLFSFDKLPDYFTAEQVTVAAEIALGLLILVLSAQHGSRALPPGPARYDAVPAGWGIPQQPHQPPHSPQPQQWPPAAGGFGPPPNLPPKLPPAFPPNVPPQQ